MGFCFVWMDGVERVSEIRVNFGANWRKWGSYALMQVYFSQDNLTTRLLWVAVMLVAQTLVANSVCSRLDKTKRFFEDLWHKTDLSRSSSIVYQCCHLVTGCRRLRFSWLLTLCALQMFVWSLWWWWWWWWWWWSTMMMF